MHLLPSALAAFTLLYFTRKTTASVSTIIVTQTSASVPATATSTQYTDDTSFESAMLSAHNFYRAEHNTSALSWNDTSASYAKSWSSKCGFEHSGGPTGENLAAGYANASASVDAWGLEREKYNWKSPGFSEATGHFTQLVWGNTTSVGCGRMSCQGSDGTPGWYVVCEYYPAGNVVGDGGLYFKWNVHKQVEGKESDTVESGVTSGGSSAVVAMSRVVWCLAGVAVLVIGGVNFNVG